MSKPYKYETVLVELRVVQARLGALAADSGRDASSRVGAMRTVLGLKLQ